MRRFAALLLTLVFLAGCAGSSTSKGSTSPAPATGGSSTGTPAPAPAPAPAPKVPPVLTVGHTLDPVTLNPQSTTTAAFQNVYGQILEQLVIFEADKATIAPMLATSWTWQTPTTLEMKLLAGVKFSNGEEFNADAAKYSLDILLNNTRYAQYFAKGVYKETQVVDPTTIRIHLNFSYAAFLGGLARGSSIFPPKYHKEVGEEAFGKKPIGTGPFVLSEWVKDSHITLTRFDGWHKGKHPIEKVIFKVIPEDTARIAALDRGEIDVAVNLPISAVARLQSNTNVVLHQAPGLRKFVTYFDTKSGKTPELKDPRVRQALNYAVDKAAIAKSLFQGAADPLPGQVMTATEAGYNPNIKMFPYDPEKAKKLLAEAGFPNGFNYQLTYTVGRYPLDKELGEIVASYLEKVGIKVSQRALEYGAFINVRNEKQLGNHQWGLLLPPDPHFNWNLYVKDTIYEFHRMSDAWNDMVAQGARETDAAKRQDLYNKVAQTAFDDPPMLYLIVPRDIYGVTKRVQGFKPRTDQVLWLYDLKLN